jgi:integrase/recombinase XerD
MRRLSATTALAPPGPSSLAIVVNRCASSTSISFMAEKGREGCFQEQDCLTYRFQATITNSPATGYLAFRLDNTIDTPRTYRGELPPRALPWETVQALLKSIDCQSKSGWRDYCILHLIAHYGLRPSEVASLRLDSIDWETAILHVTQHKTRSDLLLPLAPATLEILRGYLAHDRHRHGSTHPELFLRARCPSGPLQRTAISDIFDKHIQAVKYEGATHGVYSLRHAFAMRLLGRGVGVKAIGDVLGHRSLESTCTYLRLDVEALRDVALEVPGASIRKGGCHVHA